MSGLPADVRADLGAAFSATGLRQVDVAGLLGISRSLFSKVVGGSRIPSPVLARGIARELGLDEERAAMLCAFADAHHIERRRHRRPAGRTVT